MKNTLIYVFLLASQLGLAACVNGTVVPVAPQPVIQTKGSVDIDPQLLADCPPLSQLDNKPYSKADAVQTIDGWANQYSECARNHHSLASLAAKAFNINKVAAPK